MGVEAPVKVAGLIIKGVILHSIQVEGPMTIEGRELAPSLEVGQSVGCGRVVINTVATLVNFNGMSPAL